VHIPIVFPFNFTLLEDNLQTSIEYCDGPSFRWPVGGARAGGGVRLWGGGAVALVVGDGGGAPLRVEDGGSMRPGTRAQERSGLGRGEGR
jgi:hypothetical protein